MTTVPDGGEVNADLLADLESLSDEQRALLTLELSDNGRSDEIPCLPSDGSAPRASFAQEGMWYLEQQNPGSTAYVMPVGIRIRGDLSPGALERALTAVVDRHESLRTTFADIDGRPRLRVAERAAVPLPVTDLSALGADAADAAVAAAHREEAERPFDIAEGPLLRARLMVLPGGDHVLLVTFHHLVADGWSMGVFLGDLAAFYARETIPGAPEPAPLAVQYADHAAWQRAALDDRRTGGLLAYWREQFDRIPVLDLPARRPGATAGSWRGSSVPLDFGPDLTGLVESRATAARATPYMVLVAAVAVVLARWTEQRDLLIGMPVAGRDHPATEKLVGLFVNTLPLRLRLDGDPTFAEVIDRVRDACVGALDHQALPFGQMVRHLRAEHALGSGPLLQAMVALRNVPMPVLELPGGLSLELLDHPSVSTKFDICLDLAVDSKGGVGGRIEFNAELLDPAVVAAMRDGIQVLLEAGAERPESPAFDLPIGSAGRLAELATRWSGGSDPEAARTSGTLHGLFERAVDASPDAEALVCAEERLTYADLDRRANRLAWHLRASGVGTEDLVGVCLPRGAEAVVALMAILKAGAVYVPFDPSYPLARLSYMAADSGTPLIITRSSILRPETSEDGGASGPRPVLRAEDGRPVPLLCLDTEQELIAERPPDRPPAAAGEPNACYMLYTSGSTGMPKGAVNEHGRVANTLKGLDHVYGTRPADRMLAISSLNYDMSVYEIFGTLAAGATVVVCGQETSTDPERLYRLVHDERITCWSSAPAFLDLLVGYGTSRPDPPPLVLRSVGLGGDRIPPALPARLRDLVPGARLINLAGMTESSYCTLSYDVTMDAAGRADTAWGRPLPNHEVYILDRLGRPVPEGVPGQLHVGGAAPGRGYWRRPALTAERFVPNPFANEPGGRLYATGDLVRFRSDGTVEFLGRIDHQMKIRGLRIEPQEIEFALAAHPAVDEPFVSVQTGPLGRPLLCAHLTVAGDTAPGVGELRAFLGRRLPGHLVPSAFVIVDRLPLLPNGKLDRSALSLPLPESDRSALDHELVPPKDDLERVLCGVWSSVLGIERLGVQDDFFLLGGHSLLATQTVSRLRDMFAVPLSIPDMIGCGTVRELAGYMRTAGERADMDVDVVAGVILEVLETTDAEAPAAGNAAADPDLTDDQERTHDKAR